MFQKSQPEWAGFFNSLSLNLIYQFKKSYTAILNFKPDQYNTALV